jgi:hypothetical protein
MCPKKATYGSIISEGRNTKPPHPTNNNAISKKEIRIAKLSDAVNLDTGSFHLTIPYLYSLLLRPSSSIVILVLSSLKLPRGSSYPPLLLLLCLLLLLYLS